MNEIRDYPITMPGSKRALIDRIYPLLPKPTGELGAFIIPFFGTGVDSYYLSVIKGHRVIAGELSEPMCKMHNNFELVHEHAARWVAQNWKAESYKQAYLKLRSEFNEGSDYALDRAWRFYLLTRLSFNSLVRFNKSGKFNAPVGTFRSNPLCSSDRAAKHSEFIRGLIGLGVLCADYMNVTVPYGRPENVEYYDPPYVDTFSSYVAEKFDQDRFFEHLASRCKAGARWACSNSPAAREKLQSLGATIHELDRFEAMKTHTKSGGRAGEILAVFEPNEGVNDG